MTGPCNLIYIVIMGISVTPIGLAEDGTQLKTQTHDHNSNNNNNNNNIQHNNRRRINGTLNNKNNDN